MEDNANHKAAAPRTTCDICAREFCDAQTSVEDLAECYRLGYERLRVLLAGVERMLARTGAAFDAPEATDNDI